MTCFHTDFSQGKICGRLECEDPFNDEMCRDVDLEEDLLIGFSKLDRAHEKCEKNIAIMRGVMTNAGWTIERHGSVPDIDLNPPSPLCTLRGSDWKAEVQRKKQQLLEHRVHNLLVDLNGNCTSSVSKRIANEVKVVDKAYLENWFHAGEHQVQYSC